LPRYCQPLRHYATLIILPQPVTALVTSLLVSQVLFGIGIGGLVITFGYTLAKNTTAGLVTLRLAIAAINTHIGYATQYWHRWSLIGIVGHVITPLAGLAYHITLVTLHAIHYHWPYVLSYQPVIAHGHYIVIRHWLRHW